jgi:uncharacterized protein YjbI with pentapeptide repeats
MASLPDAPPSEGDDPGTGSGDPKRNVARDLLGLLGGGGVLGLVAVIVSIITLFLNQRTTQEQLSVTRYAHAIEQLGSENAPSRLTGIYELEQVARASPEQHYQLGMEILADYLRIFSPVAGDAGTPVPLNATQAAEIRAILKVLGRRPKDREPVQLDLSGVNLRGLNLRGENLTGDDFSGADFTQAYLPGANLAGVDLTGAVLTGAILTGAVLTETKLTGAVMTGAILSRANLTEADVTRTNLIEADLSRANLTGTHLAFANLMEADLFGADLTGAWLRFTNLTGADLKSTDLSGAQDLTQEQLDAAVINEDTKLPLELGTPEPPTSPTP